MTGGSLSTTQGNGTKVYVPLVIPVRISFELINHQMTAPSSVLSGLNMIPDPFLSVRRRLVEVRLVSVLNLNVSIGAVAVELCPAGVFP